jgi:hypothetical protein
VISVDTPITKVLHMYDIIGSRVVMFVAAVGCDVSKCQFACVVWVSRSFVVHSVDQGH